MTQTFDLAWALMKAEKVKKLPQGSGPFGFGLMHDPPIEAHAFQSIMEAIENEEKPKKPQRLERPNAYRPEEPLKLRKPSFVDSYDPVSPYIRMLMRTRENERNNRIPGDRSIADPEQHERGGFDD